MTSKKSQKCVIIDYHVAAAYVSATNVYIWVGGGGGREDLLIKNVNENSMLQPHLQCEPLFRTWIF